MTKEEGEREKERGGNFEREERKGEREGDEKVRSYAK